MNKAKEVQREFKKWAEKYGKIRYSFWKGDVSKQHFEDQRIAIKLLRPQKGQKIIDVACGVGLGVAQLAQRVKPAKVYGIDITKEMIAKARKNLKNMKIKNVEFKKTSVEKIPYKEGYFDGAICTHAAHHFFKPVKMFKEVHRVIRPKGKLVIVDTCSSSKLIRDFEKKLKKEEKAHYKFFKLNEIRGILKIAGFSKILGYRKNHKMYVTAYA